MSENHDDCQCDFCTGKVQGVTQEQLDSMKETSLAIKKITSATWNEVCLIVMTEASDKIREEIASTLSGSAPIMRVRFQIVTPDVHRMRINVDCIVDIEATR